jgi:ABC-2 type transport system permease protein
MNQIRSFFKSRSFRIGMYSAISSVIVIAIAVGIIMITDKLPATYTKIDMTKNQLYSISEQTEKIVRELDESVEVYLLAQSGNEDSTILNMLKRYEALNDKVDVILKDPVVYPGFVQQYTSDPVYENSIIVVSGDRSRYVTYYEMYVQQIDYSTYQRTIDFYGESCVTSAIDYVTSDNLPKAYLLTGHGENEFSDALRETITKENVEIETLSLLTVDSVPEDADILVINSPTSDLPMSDIEKVEKYLRSGGNLLLITDIIEGSTPNLDALMEDYGVSTVEGIVLEGDPNYCLSMYTHYLLPRINAHVITNPLRDGGFYALMPIAEGIVELDEKRDNVRVDALLTTSDKSFSKVAGMNMETMEKEEGDVDGPFKLGVAITDKLEDAETKIVWFTSSSLLDSSIDQMVSGGNFDLLLNSLNWMSEREDKISIHPKVIKNELLTVPASAANRWSVVLVGVMPAIFILAGVSVWVRRRRR